MPDYPVFLKVRALSLCGYYVSAMAQVTALDVERSTKTNVMRMLRDSPLSNVTVSDHFFMAQDPPESKNIESDK